MNLLTHDWNGNPITQLTTETAIAKFTIPATYVNATQMCRAHNKQFNDYARLDSTKTYWEALSTETGIPVSGLVVSIKGGNNKQAQGTWTHPEIAIDLAQWVNVEFRIWANRALRKLMTGEIITTPTPATPEPVPTLPPAPEEIAQVIDLMLGKTDLHPNLIAGVKGSAIAKLHPQLLPAIEAAKTLLPVPIESELVRPTALGEKLAEKTGEKWSAIRVNKTLIDRGFQIKNPDGKNPDYLPTEKGKEHSQLVVDTAKGHGKTIQSLQWHLSVLDALEANDH
ncbi:hypothetical protein WA1_18955 [Scytonema hofmannii PCC 7110]|uniref:KilA-N domain-containing protein n=1 Tax=Scytonema hofmannii PCC 7110 TaxID=128403 RepID=A0A139XBQ8_9CYAN|nr:KilA-N domain-containing protein [Scytonema hofmannii]KYC42083.1 hypothetical protein WA1_18955 [Scytonema hofmannii PCC 7110]